MEAYLLAQLKKKSEVDNAIRETADKVLVLRFGDGSDSSCLAVDDVMARAEAELAKMAKIYTVDVSHVPQYVKYFDISLVPSTVFFFNAHHMKVDCGTPDHTKWVGGFHEKQDFIDLVEVIYRGAVRGKRIVRCPIDPSRIPKYQLVYKGV